MLKIVGMAKPWPSGYVVHAPRDTVVLFGTIHCTGDVTFKVKNLVVFGRLLSPGTVTISASKIYSLGILEAKQLNADYTEYHFGPSDRALEEVEALGVHITWGDRERLKVSAS